ncbi:MAG: class I SAM-dependent methyltransferase [Gemmatimonadetes bacterium]|nr:class I SAM-dependent methyltransferase [Gemmatimonadota bacterium]MDA1103296.1 class I SAM-dependent methyltransferase [Gemmatimonadota bacterium]
MSHSVRRHLRVDVAAYDATIRRFIPGYVSMLETAAEAVAAVKPGLVVDLGAGTGALSEALLSRSEVGTVELLDVDAQMMHRARARLEVFGDRARFTLRSFDEAFSPCDAFAASLSLHHIPTLEAKSALFERAFQALSPGGVLVNADANMPTEPRARERLFDMWAAHMVASGITAKRARQHFEHWANEDTYLPVDAELAELRTIGFEAERVWERGPIGVVVARKPA